MLVFPHSLSLYNYSLLLYLPSAVLGFYYDWKYRGAPFRVFVPAAVGGLATIYYVVTALPQIGAFYFAQIAALSLIAAAIYIFGLAGGDDMIWMITLSMIFAGASFIFVAGAILLFGHKIYRSIRRLHDNPYKDRYPRFYPYPMVAYMAVGLVAYTIFSFIFLGVW
jgi:hypothetical protein